MPMRWNLKNINRIAIFYGDFTSTAVYDLADKISETGIVNFDLYEKKEFSHGKYNYFMNNSYDLIIYFKQKNVSKYEKDLIELLKVNNEILIIESKFNGISAEYDLIFKSFALFNELISDKDLKLYNESFKKLYNFEGDFS